MWIKFPDETKVVEAEWTDLLAGDTIDGDVTLVIKPDTTTFEATLLVTENNVSRIRLAGGEAGDGGYIVATINTVGGQTLKPAQPFKIKSRNSEGS